MPANRRRNTVESTASERWPGTRRSAWMTWSAHRRPRSKATATKTVGSAPRHRSGMNNVSPRRRQVELPSRRHRTDMGFTATTLRRTRTVSVGVPGRKSGSNRGSDQHRACIAEWGWVRGSLGLTVHGRDDRPREAAVTVAVIVVLIQAGSVPAFPTSAGQRPHREIR